jgi:hypothetical protein
MHRHPDLIGRRQAVAAALARKCEHAGIGVPTLDATRSSPFRQEIEAEWQNMLGHQLPQPLPPFTDFWSALDDVFRWLDGTLQAAALPRASLGDLDPAWRLPQAITSWRRSVPLELLRYAGANRLKVDIDYRAESGRRGPRRVEPYSLRRTKDSNLVLFVVNDRRQLRSYRVDRIAGIKPTTEPVHPRLPSGILIQRTPPAAAERHPSARNSSGRAVHAGSSASNRTARAVSQIAAMAGWALSLWRVPGLKYMYPWPATTVISPSGSNRAIPAVSASKSTRTSPDTAASTSSGPAPRATSVATRRNAACSPAIRGGSSELRSCELFITPGLVSRPEPRLGHAHPRAARLVAEHGFDV